MTVSELADRFNITPETVRRDLDTLEGARAVAPGPRGRGGHRPAEHVRAKPEERQTQRHDEKSRIAAAAVEMIPASRTGSIILDAGTTTERLADDLVEWKPSGPGDQLLVITNAVPIAYKLAGNDEIQLHVLGGRVRGLTRAIVGAGTIGQLDGPRPDIAFVGANGVHADFGLSTPTHRGGREDRHRPLRAPRRGAGRFLETRRGDPGPVRPVPGRSTPSSRTLPPRNSWPPRWPPPRSKW